MDGLVCIDCGAKHEPHVARCDCGGALDHVGLRPMPTKEDLLPSKPGRRGVWRHHKLLGIPKKSIVTLGEGDTPLVHDEVLGAHFKCEFLNPTGSFKDRGATATVSFAKSLGAELVVEDSSGNAGTAVAAYAAKAGIPCAIFAPSFITAAKRAQIEALGAELHVVPGPRRGVTETAVHYAAERNGYYASHTYPPHFVESCATLAYELVRDLGHIPDVIITPAAMGSILIGCHRGFDRLLGAELIDRVPRLVAVQASGYDPVVRALGSTGGSEMNDVADGLLINEPPRKAQMIEAVKATGGTALAVGNEATLAALKRLHARGLLAEPSSAVTVAALDRLRDEGRLEPDQTVVAVLTGRWKPT